MKTKVLRLDDVRFYGLLLKPEKNFSQTSILELKKEFERRKMLKPDMVGGVCVHSTSVLLKKRIDLMFPKLPKEDKKFVHSTEELKDFFKIFEELRPKRRYIKRKEKDLKQSAYERLLLEAKMNEMLEEMLKTEKDVKTVERIIKSIVKSKKLKPFKNFLTGDETKTVLKLLLSRVCEKIYGNKLKVISGDEDIINLYNSRVRGI